MDQDCRSVTVQVKDQQGLVTFVTRDGRRAVRQIASPGALLSVVEALSYTLPVVEPLPPPGEELRPNGPAPARAESPLASSNVVVVPPATLSVILVGRGGGEVEPEGGFVSPVLSAAAAVSVGRWEVGVFGKWNPAYGVVGARSPADFQMSAWGVGVNVGKREPIGAMTIVAGGTLSATVTTESGKDPSGELAFGPSQAEPRAGAYVGLVVPSHSRVRARPELSADVVATRIGHGLTIDNNLPALPWWGATASVGLEWEVP
jgi:hypothetical protein